MEHAVQRFDSPDPQKSPEIVPAAEVLKALSAILQSPPFHSSKQSQELLNYIVDQTLAGHPEMLKERIIGAHVFNRRPDYDTNDDPIVRSRASEVRKRLAVYYQTAREEPVQISIPSGSFRATFEWTRKNPAQVPPDQPHHREENESLAESSVLQALHPLAETGPRPSSASSHIRRWLILILIIAASLILTWAVQRYFANPDERAFNQFWSPIFNNSHTVLIYIGSNAVYELSDSYVDAYYRQHPRTPREEMGFESYIPLSPGTKIDAQDLFPAKDTFVTIGDVAATTKIVSFLVRRDKQFDVRFGSDVAFGDLREDPTILIGAHNNAWTLAMTENLRYVFDGRNAIEDRTDSRKRWTTTPEFAEDYAIVSRVLSSKTGTTVLTAAGIGHAGTRAAAEFLTNPQSIAALVRTLPKGWQKKNLQVVLHTSVINQIPSAPDVVATYSW